MKYPPGFEDSYVVHKASLLKRCELILFFLAAITLGRAIVQRNDAGVPWIAYEQGHARLPFQERYLMAPALRWAHGSPAWNHASRILVNSVKGPEELAIQLVDVCGILLAGWSVTQLRNRMSPRPLFYWLPRWCLIWVLMCTYVVRYEQAIYEPYDLLSLGLFSLGVLCCARGWLFPFLLTLIVATYNRETAVFLVPIWIACNYRTSMPLRKLAFGAVSGVASWAAIKLQILHWIGAKSTGLELMIGPNLHTLLPNHLPQVFTVGGFLLIPLLLLRGEIQDGMLKRIWIGFTPFIVGALTVGLWNETRIFGEMSPAFACTAAVVFESILREKFTYTVPVQQSRPSAPVGLHELEEAVR